MLDAELVDGGLQRNRYSCEMRYPHFSSLSLSSLLSLSRISFLFRFAYFSSRKRLYSKREWNLNYFVEKKNNLTERTCYDCAKSLWKDKNSRNLDRIGDKFEMSEYETAHWHRFLTKKRRSSPKWAGLITLRLPPNVAHKNKDEQDGLRESKN